MNKLKERSIALIGAGTVGAAYMYAAINHNLASQYGIIDLNEDLVKGRTMDYQDAIGTSLFPFHINKIEYRDLKDYDVIMITAGTSQKTGETRLKRVGQNAKIIANIAKEVKASGFSGVTIIASNPVDVLCYIYQKVTGFNNNLVIGSGTSIDTSRLRNMLSKKLEVSPSSINAHILGEHGDSSMLALSTANIAGKPLNDYIKEGMITQKEIDQIVKDVRVRGYQVLQYQGASYYAIGEACVEITEAVLKNTNKVYTVSTYLDHQFNVNDIYMGVPAVIGIDGVKKIINIPLSSKEQKEFDNSFKVLHEALDIALAAIK